MFSVFLQGTSHTGNGDANRLIPATEVFETREEGDREKGTPGTARLRVSNGSFEQFFDLKDEPEFFRAAFVMNQAGASVAKFYAPKVNDKK